MKPPIMCFESSFLAIRWSSVSVFNLAALPPRANRIKHHRRLYQRLRYSLNTDVQFRQARFRLLSLPPGRFLCVHWCNSFLADVKLLHFISANLVSISHHCSIDHKETPSPSPSPSAHLVCLLCYFSHHHMRFYAQKSWTII